MKNILFFLLLLLLPLAACGQFTNNPNKIRLGNQTTGLGLLHPSNGVPSWTPTTVNNAWSAMDTITGTLYAYFGGQWNALTGKNGVYSAVNNNDTLRVEVAFIAPGEGFTIRDTSGAAIFDLSESAATLGAGNGYIQAVKPLGYLLMQGDSLLFNSAGSFGTAGQVITATGNGGAFWQDIQTIDSTTASNGLTETSNNIKLGGALIENTTISGNFQLSRTGTLNSTDLFSSVNSGTTSGGVYGQGTSYGVAGFSSAGRGVQANSTSGVGLYAASSTGNTVATLYHDPTSTTTALGTLELIRRTTGTAGVGMGTGITYRLETASGIESTAGQTFMRWTDPDNLNKASSFEVWNLGTNVLGRKLALLGSGSLILDGYKSDSTARIGTGWGRLAVQADGTVVADTTTATGGSGVNIYNADDTLTGSRTVEQLGYTLDFSGSVSNVALVTATNAGEDGIGLQGEGQSTGVVGIGASGVLGISTLYPLYGQQTGAGTGVLPGVLLFRDKPSILTGDGISADFWARNSSSSAMYARMAMVPTSVTASSESARLDLSTINAGSFATRLSILSTGQIQLPNYTTDTFVGTGWGKLAVDATGVVVVDTTTTGGGGTTIDSLTYANDTLSLYTSDGTFTAEIAAGGTPLIAGSGIEIIGDSINWNGTITEDVFMSSEKYIWLQSTDGVDGKFIYIDKDFLQFSDIGSGNSAFLMSSLTAEVGIQGLVLPADAGNTPAMFIKDTIIYLGLGWGDEVSVIRLSPRNDTDSSTFKVFNKYFLPNAAPSTTLNDTTIMAWRGDGATAEPIGFIPLPSGGSGTWLKPQLESDTVVINSATNTLAFNITNSADPAISPTIRIQMPGPDEDETATGIEMRDTVNQIYMRDLYNGSFIREANAGMTFRTADTAQTIRFQSGSGYAQQTGGIDGNLRVVNGYGKGAKLRLTDYTNGGGYVQVASPDTVTAAYTLILPKSGGTVGQVLTKLTGDSTTWATPATGGVTGTGTTGTIPVWSGATALGDSPLTVASGNVAATGTGSFRLPNGTDAQRPGTPSAGETRYSTTNGTQEWYAASAWERGVRSASATGLGTSTQIPFFDANGRLTNSSKITFTEATGQQIITSSSQGLRVISTTNDAAIFQDSYGATVYPGFVARHARGTQASPSGTLAGDYLTFFGGRGTTTAGTFSTGSAGYIGIIAESNFGADSGSGSAYMIFATTAAGSSGTERMRITGAGSVGIGNTTPQATLHITGSFSRGAPVTKTGNFTVAATENWLIVNNAGANTTVTLPAASTNTGRELMFKNLSGSFTVISIASNVVPLAGGAAGTAILPATAGAWATLVSDGTNWIIMQQ